jgi:hypothetical protein
LTSSVPTEDASQAPAADASQAPPAQDASPQAYDLDSDVRARIEDIRAELGADTQVRVEHAAFILAGPQPSAAFSAAALLAHKALVAYFNGRFTRGPDRPVAVYLFASGPAYEAYCTRRFGETCSTSFGVYHRSSREIVLEVASGTTTLTHELVHPIVQSDFPEAPAWLDEGLAALYENPTFPAPGEVHGATNWRGRSLRDALDSRTDRPRVRLERLFAMGYADFHAKSDQDLNYAMARYLCQWLDASGKLWPFYQAWRDGVASDPASDPAGEKNFARVVGKTPAEASAPWLKWLETQGLATETKGRGRQEAR